MTEPRPKTRPLRPGLRHSLVRAVFLLSVPLVLTACGAGGGSGGGTPPEPVLSTTFTLPDYQVGSDTWIRYGYLLRINEDYGGTVRYFPRVEVPESRTVEIEYDEREIDEQFDAGTFFKYYLPWVDGSPATAPVVSNPDVLLKASSNLRVQQQDPAVPGSFLFSHVAELRHSYLVDDAQLTSRMRAVFAEGALSVEGTYTTSIDDVVVDIDLVQGWNLLYFERNWEGTRRSTTYRARPAEDDFGVGASIEHQFMRGAEVEFDATFISLFAQRRLVDPTYGSFMYAVGWQAGPGWKEAYTPNWIHPDLIESDGLPFAEAVGAVPGSGTVNGADDLRVTLGGFQTYPEGAPDFGDVAASNGRFHFSFTEGNFPLLLMYADRTATVHVDSMALADSAFTVQTEASGLNLDFGWNFVAAVPADDTGSLLTLTRVDRDSEDIQVEVVAR